MKILVIGGGWYGCHIALALKREGHEIVLNEISDKLFSGASGGNPARLHLGFHYPRSKLTRAACQEHNALFMHKYGFLTRCVPLNLYAIASDESSMDFGTYSMLMKDELECLRVHNPMEYGLHNVEGALLTTERHIVIEEARKYFTTELGDTVVFGDLDQPREVFDVVIDCTFCANSTNGVQRYEPCMTVILEGPAEKAVTIMDGPFPSIYPWNESKKLSSLTSAKFTPLARCSTRAEAERIIADTPAVEINNRAFEMWEQMGTYLPEIYGVYNRVDVLLSIRAMPLSAADARLVDVACTGEKTVSVRAGKIDAVLYAEQLVKEKLKCLR